jgi:predicted RNA-binding Zn ribbon-like protein
MDKHPADVPALNVGQSRKPPPGDLVLVQGAINTHDLEDGRDDWSDPEALERWLTHYGLMESGGPLSVADLDQARRVREALRDLLMANNGAELDRRSVDTLNAAAKTAELLVRFDPSDGGEASLVPMRGGVDGAIGRLLAIVERSQCDGTWKRFKACPDEECGWAFYDWSKNRSATWCSMEVCGNRAKARAYRERHRGHSHP